jgi:outer membrane protein TolC
MKRCGSFLLILIFILALVSLSFSQENQKLSLNDCIKTALENNSQLKNASRDIKLAETDIITTISSKIPGSGLLPRIDAYFSSGRYIQGQRTRKADVPVGIDPLTGNILYERKDITQEKIESNSHRATVELNQNLWDWGRSWYQLSQTKLLKQSKEISLTDMRNTVIYNVQEKYFELLKAFKLAEVYEEAVKRSEEQLNRIQSMYEIGSVALADVYKAKVALGNDQINLINQKNTVIIAKASLNNAMGLDPNSPTEIIEREAEQLSVPYTLDDALKISSDKNPGLKNFELNIKNYQYARRVAKLAYLPAIGGSISYSRDNEYFNRVYNKKLDENYTATIGVQMNLNIFKGFADKAEVERQTINYAKAEEDLIEKERLLKTDVTQAFNILKANKEIVEINATNLESANEDLRLAQERYKIGAGTLLEAIDAQLAVTQARSTLVSARYNYQIALSYLKVLMNVVGQ